MEEILIDPITKLFDENSEVRELFKRYVLATVENYPNAKVFSFTEIYNNVSKNLLENSTIEDTMISVLKSMVYMSENSVNEMIARAEADFHQRYLKMTPEQRKVCDKYRLKF